jgi:hypothetical protein
MDSRLDPPPGADLDPLPGGDLDLVPRGDLDPQPGADLDPLPGGDLVATGIADLARGVESIPALLVSIGADRLRRAGLAVPDPVFPSPERRLYDRLASGDSDSAHARYNALIRRLVSCERALECASR